MGPVWEVKVVTTDNQPTLEQALAMTEENAAQTVEVARKVVGSLRKFEGAAREGRLKDMRASMEAAEKAMVALGQQLANAREGWRFDEEQYFANGRYSKELVAAGEKAGLKLFERDERLYCYPALLRVSGADRAVFVDKKRQTRVRPTVMVSILKDLQKKPPRFKPEAFLAALWEAYSRLVAANRRQNLTDGPPVPLLDIYDLVTLLPGQSREYTRQEFARDIYLLNRSPVSETKSGARVSFLASTGTKTPSRTLGVITEDGEEKRYYAIVFTQSRKEQ